MESCSMILICCFVIFFFKQKTAYEMRISDWSSDVCSSDLVSFRIVVPGSDLAAALDEGAVDLALGAFGKVPARTILEPLYREELVWIASVHNPVARPPVNLAQIAKHTRHAIAVGKSTEERRVGNECVSTCTSRWSRYH